MADFRVGSCGLTYNLYQTSPSNDPYSFPSLPSRSGRYKYHPILQYLTCCVDRFMADLFDYVFYAVLAVLVYSLLRNVLLKVYPRIAPPPASSFFPWGGGGGGGGGGPGFNNPGGGGGAGGPPPPYSKIPETAPTQPAGNSNNLWTGLALGGAAGYLAANARRNNNQNGSRDLRDRPARGRVDWEDERDTGIGSSTGPMRRATGFGGSTTR